MDAGAPRPRFVKSPLGRESSFRAGASGIQGLYRLIATAFLLIATAFLGPNLDLQRQFVVSRCINVPTLCRATAAAGRSPGRMAREAESKMTEASGGRKSPGDLGDLNATGSPLRRRQFGEASPERRSGVTTRLTPATRQVDWRSEALESLS